MHLLYSLQFELLRREELISLINKVKFRLGIQILHTQLNLQKLNSFLIA